MNDPASPQAAGAGHQATLNRLFYKYRGVAFNLAVLVLFLLAQPAIRRRLILGISHNRLDVPLGLALVTLQLLELWALRTKLPAVEQRLRSASAEAKSGSAGFILWVFHMGVNTALLYPIARCFGISPNPADGPFKEGWFLLAATLLVLKEVLVLLAINPRWFERARRAARVSRGRELLADGVLLFYTGLSFMVLLDFAGIRANLQTNDAVQLVIGLVLVALLMLVLLLPLRLAYIIEEWETLQSPLDGVIFVVSIFVLLGGALISFV